MLKWTLLVIIDNFSRFIELYPVQSANARETAQRLLEFFGRYGTPRRILSDRGPEFVNEVIKHLFETMKLEHTKTLAYSKQENSIVERSNSDIYEQS
jgi:transposase InsO family protein